MKNNKVKHERTYLDKSNVQKCIYTPRGEKARWILGAPHVHLHWRGAWCRLLPSGWQPHLESFESRVKLVVKENYGLGSHVTMFERVA